MAAQQLHASFPNSFFPGVFPNSWQLPDFLSSAPILEWLLLLLHTHALLHFPLRGRGGWLRDFRFCSLPRHFAQERPRQFYFQFSNSIFGTLRKKNYCHLHISSATVLFPPCPSSPSQGGLLDVAVLLQQRCCVCIPRETVAEFHPIAMTPVTVGVSPSLSCTLRVWASTFSGCTMRLMLEVKMFMQRARYSTVIEWLFRNWSSF